MVYLFYFYMATKILSTRVCSSIIDLTSKWFFVIDQPFLLTLMTIGSQGNNFTTWNRSIITVTNLITLLLDGNKTVTPGIQNTATTDSGGDGAGDVGEDAPLKDDSQTLARCLTIICQMLKSPEITAVGPTLYSLHDNLLLPCLKNQVRVFVFKCFKN